MAVIFFSSGSMFLKNPQWLKVYSLSKKYKILPKVLEPLPSEELIHLNMCIYDTKHGNSTFIYKFSSVQFSCSVVSDSLRPRELQHARPPCPSPTPRVHSDSRPPSQWCHPAISSSVVPFSSCPQSLPAWVFSSESTLRMRWPKYWSFSFTSFLPKKSQGWSPSEWTNWISLQSKGLSRVFSNTTVQKHQFFGTQPSSQSNSHICYPYNQVVQLNII